MSSGVAINRKVVREALGTQLGTALTSAVQVYDYLYSRFDVESPIVRIVTDGSNRPPIYSEGIRSTFYYALQFWVAYYEDGTPQVQSDAEDILDTLEYEFTVWLEANQIGTLWTMVSVDGRSRVQTVQTRGAYWIVETIPLAVEVYG
jgi:hypothetical protein